MEKDQNINPESQNEEIKETETGEQIQEGQEDTVEKNEEIKENETERINEERTREVQRQRPCCARTKLDVLLP